MDTLIDAPYDRTPVFKAIIENHPNGEDKGLRFNKGKERYDLLEPFAIKELVKVFTKGAEKYADRNWEVQTVLI